MLRSLPRSDSTEPRNAEVTHTNGREVTLDPVLPDMGRDNDTAGTPDTE
ncbi:MAG: hypothetical protein Rubg2KO_25900 [Rubricoccaceae bacterium]